jgi:hypothetical protein
MNKKIHIIKEDNYYVKTTFCGKKLVKFNNIKNGLKCKTCYSNLDKAIKLLKEERKLYTSEINEEINSLIKLANNGVIIK